jgi:energy-converting hydrogenase Eha subunit B
LLGYICNGRESGYAAGSVRPAKLIKAKPIKKAGGVATAGFFIGNISCSHLDQRTP